MKNIFSKNKTIILVIALILGWFYWFQWRPVQIRKDCIARFKKNAREGFKYTQRTATLFYRECVIEQGMNPEDLIPSNLLD